MLTVQEIQAINFEKAVFGGYDMKAVDEFLEQITEDFAAMQKENAALKSKMKVLVDKIEEYRSVEEGMRKALVSAQSIARDTLDKAKAEAEQLLLSARTEAESRIENYRIQLAAESKKLEEAKAKNAEFTEQLKAVYEEQLRSLDALMKSGVLDSTPSFQVDSTFPTEPIAMASASSAQPLLENTQPYDISEEIESVKPSEEKKETRFNITEVSLASSEKPDVKQDFDFSDLAFGVDSKREKR